nr:unnamed protein product [Callosobruchus chinensis]
MGITSSSRLHSLQILQKLVYAKTDEEFETFYETLKQTAPKAVFEYFNKNWYNTRDEWSMSGKFMRGCFQNSTNNRIESINAKLKSVITKNSKLEGFLHSFFDILSTLEGERDYKAVYHLQKRLVLSYSPDSDERKYMDFLTHESAKLVIKQIVYSKRVTLPTLTTSDSEVSIFSIKSSEGELQTNTFECNCNFNVSMLLPCRHIFAVRRHLGLPLFSTEIINKRWTQNYYSMNQRCLAQMNNCSGVEIDPVVESNLDPEIQQTITVTSIPNNKPQTFGQKRKHTLRITDSLANLIALSSNQEFEQKVDNLKILEMIWRQGKRARIVMVNEEDSQPGTSKTTASSISEPMSEKTNQDLNWLDNIPIVIDDCDAKYTIEQTIPVNDKHNQEEKSIFHNDDLSNIKMPMKIKTRGRPEGADLTAIGVPKRKKGTAVAFFRVPYLLHQKAMLKWFVDEEIASLAIDGEVIEEKFVEVIAENIAEAILHEDVNINFIR